MRRVIATGANPVLNAARCTYDCRSGFVSDADTAPHALDGHPARATRIESVLIELFVAIPRGILLWAMAVQLT